MEVPFDTLVISFNTPGKWLYSYSVHFGPTHSFHPAQEYVSGDGSRKQHLSKKHAIKLLRDGGGTKVNTHDKWIASESGEIWFLVLVKQTFIP